MILQLFISIFFFAIAPSFSMNPESKDTHNANRINQSGRKRKPQNAPNRELTNFIKKVGQEADDNDISSSKWPVYPCNPVTYSKATCCQNQMIYPVTKKSKKIDSDKNEELTGLIKKSEWVEFSPNTVIHNETAQSQDSIIAPAMIENSKKSSLHLPSILNSPEENKSPLPPMQTLASKSEDPTILFTTDEGGDSFKESMGIETAFQNNMYASLLSKDLFLKSLNEAKQNLSQKYVHNPAYQRNRGLTALVKKSSRAKPSHDAPPILEHVTTKPSNSLMDTNKAPQDAEPKLEQFIIESSNPPVERSSSMEEELNKILHSSTQ